MRRNAGLSGLVSSGADALLFVALPCLAEPVFNFYSPGLGGFCCPVAEMKCCDSVGVEAVVNALFGFDVVVETA
ncbi:hypothetical protein FRC0485_00576 [Corynebacterium diphtheriae]|nr:hypothetical protein FRC0485_00576 [Corynebacterium diphtheriae]CAB0986155.1 hypothetical protein FRC0493_00593 [Corynebacterium diphtheriae]